MLSRRPTRMISLGNSLPRISPMTLAEGAGSNHCELIFIATLTVLPFFFAVATFSTTHARTNVQSASTTSSRGQQIAYSFDRTASANAAAASDHAPTARRRPAACTASSCAAKRNGAMRTSVRPDTHSTFSVRLGWIAKISTATRAGNGAAVGVAGAV